MAGLDVVGGGFGVVEHVVGGLDVIPAGEQRRDTPARVGGHGGGDDPDPPVSRGVSEVGAGELGVGPGLRLGVGDDQVQGPDADEFEDAAGGPRQDPGTGGDRGVGVGRGRGAGPGRGVRDRVLRRGAGRGPHRRTAVAPRDGIRESTTVDGEDGSRGTGRRDPGVAPLFGEDEDHRRGPGGMLQPGREVKTCPLVYKRLGKDKR